MNRVERPNITMWDRPEPADWRSGCVALAAMFMLGLLLGFMIGTGTASRSAQATTPPVAPSGSDDAQAPRMTLRSTVSAVSEQASASPELSAVPYSPRPTPHQVAVATGDVLAMEGGIASHMGSTQGPGYLALPGGPGISVRICGPIGCVPRNPGAWIVSTDAGPDLEMQRAGRVADLNVYDFERVCGPRSMGTCHVTVEYE